VRSVLELVTYEFKEHSNPGAKWSVADIRTNSECVADGLDESETVSGPLVVPSVVKVGEGVGCATCAEMCGLEVLVSA